jgi:uncharacterized protein YbaA (DUF1428 family)
MKLEKCSLIADALLRTLLISVALFGLHGTVYADCIDDAAAFQHVNVSLMRGIAQVESGMQPDRVNTNSNGTTDIGLMQINSSWLPVLAREGISEQSLFDPCTNAYVGAWILSENIRQFGPNWNAVGAYNATSPDRRLSYARKVYDAVQSIAASPDSPMPILPPSFTPPQTYSPFASLEIAPVQTGRPHAAAQPLAPAPQAPSGAVLATSAAYNFGWTVTGADQAKPMQVFDDGSRVFVQFVDMKHVPAIFADTPSGRVLLRWDLQFPYAVIGRPEQTLIFQSGSYEARAVRAASGASATQVSTPEVAGHDPASKVANPAPIAQKGPEAKGAHVLTTDALWYVSSPSTMDAPASPSPSPKTPLHAATHPASVQPAASQAAVPQNAKPALNTDALWYINAR